MSTFDEVLDNIRKETKGSSKTRERGTRFELLMKQFFETDDIWKKQFKKIEMWNTYRGINGDVDKGIDLVGTHYDGTECAIQCKCWNDDAILDLKDIATTFADKDRYKKMNRVIIVFTGKRPTKHVSKHIIDTNSTLLMKDKLRESPIDWNENKLKSIIEPKILKQHQTDAINSTLEKFKKHDRGQLIMACGTGKTLVSLNIAEQHVGNRGGGGLYYTWFPQYT